MEVNAFRCRLLRRLGELPCPAWLCLHVLLYLGVGAAGVTLWELGLRRELAETLIAVTVGVVWFSPLVVSSSIAATFCLGVLRVLSDVRWYWFRLAAILLFAVPLPLFLLNVSGPGTALPVAAIQLATALLIIQPRDNPTGWAHRDPAMDDHHW